MTHSIGAYRIGCHRSIDGQPWNVAIQQTMIDPLPPLRLRSVNGRFAGTAIFPGWAIPPSERLILPVWLNGACSQS
jgi:hypothetical protein